MISPDLPIGDFDKQKPVIVEPHRLYRTQKGWRVFYTDRWRPDISVMMLQMTMDGADPMYVLFHLRHQFYSARISMKNWEHSSAAELVGEVGPRFWKWDKFILLHDELSGVGSDVG